MRFSNLAAVVIVAFALINEFVFDYSQVTMLVTYTLVLNMTILFKLEETTDG